jgi:hypothetical protein
MNREKRLSVLGAENMKGEDYYHVTAVEAIEQIMREGLKGGTKPRNRGKRLKRRSVFVLTTCQETVTDDVAINQIWPSEDIEQYAVLRIAPDGVIGQVLPDEVAEFLARFQRIIQQTVIEPKYLELVKTRRIEYPGRMCWEIMEKAVLRRKLTPEEWKLACRYMDQSLIEVQKRFEEVQSENTEA